MSSIVYPENPHNIIAKSYIGKTPLIFWNHEGILRVSKFIEGTWTSSCIRGLPGRISKGEENRISRLIKESFFISEGPFVVACAPLMGGASPSIDTIKHGPSLYKWLKQNPKAKDLKLSGDKIDYEGVSSIVYALRYSNISTLWINHCGLDRSTIQLFAQNMPNLPVTWLDLSGNQIGNEGMEFLAPQLYDCLVSNLNLNDNLIDEKGITKLANELPLTSLLILHLSGNPLGNSGTRILASGLPGSSLLKLNLNSCGIGDDGLEALANKLPATSICHLQLAKNEIGDTGIYALSKILPKTSITRLSLRGNKITKNGLEHLCQLLSSSWVIEIDLSDNPCQVTDELEQLLQQNLEKLKRFFRDLKQKNLSTKTYLMKQKAPHVLLDHEENTPLHIAVLNQDEDLVKFLFETGSPKSFNRHGQTPLALAQQNSNIIAILTGQNLIKRFYKAHQNHQNRSVVMLGNQLSICMLQQGDSVSAKEIIEKTLPFCAQTSFETGLLMLRWATCLFHLNQFNEANEKIRQATEILDPSINQIFEDKPIEFLNLQNGLAIDALFLLRSQNRSICVSNLMFLNNQLGPHLKLLAYVKDVKSLNLCSNRIDDTHIPGICDFLQNNPQVERLSLANNQITFLGIQKLLPYISNLNHLEIWGNPITNEGAKLLFNAPLPHLHYLTIDNCNFTEELVPYLCEFLYHNRTLLKIGFNLDFIEEYHWKDIATALENNYSCISLGLDGLYKDAHHEIETILNRNRNCHAQFLQAAQNGDENEFRRLLQLGLPSHVQDEIGNTPLHLAVEHSQYNIIKINSNEKESPNLSGQTPLDIAQLRSDYKAIELLGGQPHIQSHKQPVTNLRTNLLRDRIIPNHIIDERISPESVSGIIAFRYALRCQVTAIIASQLMAHEVDWAEIYSLLSTHSSIVHLDLRNNNLSTYALTSILRGIRACSLLKVLHISGNTNVPFVIDALKDLIANHPSLQEIYLCHCDLKTEHFEKLALGIEKNESLRKISFNYNKPGKQGIEALTKALQNHKNIYQLELRGCIDIESEQALSILISSSNLRFLDLGRNNLNFSIGSCLYNIFVQGSGLIYLGLANTNQSIVNICASLFNDNTLSFLDLSGYSPNQQEMESLKEISRKNKTLKKFNSMAKILS